MIGNFFQMIIESIARGFGFTLGRDAANIAVHEVEEKLGGGGGE